MDTWIELNNQTYYEVRTSWEEKTAQGFFDSAIENKIERENKIRSLIKGDLDISIEEFNELKIWVVDDIAIILNENLRWNLYIYSENNWLEFLNWLLSAFEDEHASTHAKEAWFELKWKSIFKNWKEIKVYLENWEINPNFILAINKINFYQNLWIHYWVIKSIKEWKWDKVTIDIMSLKASIASWAIRIKDIVYFAWKWYIPEEDDVRMLLRRAIIELPNQCLDTRFYENAQWVRMWLEVTKQELDEYLNPTEWKPLITIEIYNLCIKAIEKRDTLLQNQKETREQASSSLKVEKTKNWMLDKISDLLWWD